ncbi:MAG: transcription antitermination factor NusB [Alphaproteobacteria bacterium]|nr:transcription antitermination factor NusB [Alphaproteobacteria bacterium]MBV8549522.1 transcription antitermination factor NusB [Alphaproteobacteria bacterium]
MAKSGQDYNAKRLARLAAVQALYQTELTQRPIQLIIKDFLADPKVLLQDQDEGGLAVSVDRDLFVQVAQGTHDNLADIDGMIAGAVDAKVTAERVETLLKAILRAGIFELRDHSFVPTGVVINDYVDVAHAYFNAREPGLVNAVLDRVGKTLRA